VLAEFESEMLERSAIKVKHSAEAAQFPHSEIVSMRVMTQRTVPNEKRGLIINTLT
jgi:hypothetical protein